MSNKHKFTYKDQILNIKREGKWSKYGGGVYGIIRAEIENVWYCQCCGTESPKELQPFLLELYPDEFIRICNICASKKIVVKRRLIIIEH